jgi:lipoprotein NlpI
MQFYLTMIVFVFVLISNNLLAVAQDPAKPPSEKISQYDKLIADFTAAIKLQPKSSRLYQGRGVAYFKAGRFKESVADFDKYLKSHPGEAPYHWQRGISHYYAGMYKEGVAQFELHRKVNPEDVENAIWHYLCKAKIEGVDKARSALIPIAKDSRSWAAKAFLLYHEKITPQQYLKEMTDKGGNKPELANRLFYTHLYIGLFHEARGKASLAKKHITAAWEKYPSSHYMGDVARVHADLFKKKTGKKKESSSSTAPSVKKKS